MTAQAQEGGATAPPSNPFAYDFWPSGEPYQWTADPDSDGSAERGMKSWDNIDFHVDLGCGRLRKGRIGVDRFPSEATDVIADLDHGVWTHGLRLHPGGEYQEVNNEGVALRRTLRWPPTPPTSFRAQSGLAVPAILGLPFGDSSIQSIISHHAFEHVADLIALVDECYRVLVPDGVLRIITPLFPSKSAVEDPDHKKFIMPDTFDSFCGDPGNTPQNCWLASFSVPYTSSRFKMEDKDTTPIKEGEDVWEIAREIRVAMRAVK